jgi:hypothetical protein
MDWKKILEAVKLPIVAIAVWYVLAYFLTTLLPPEENLWIGLNLFASFRAAMGDMNSPLYSLPILAGFAITFWLGQRGEKLFAFNYVDSAVAGIILGVAAAITFSVLSFAYFSPIDLSSILRAMVWSDLIGIILSVVVCLAGTFIAKNEVKK